MSMFFSREIHEKIAGEVIKVKNHLQIITAYCKYPAISFIENNIKNDIPNKKLMVRFTYNDIVSGASDLEVYEFCKKNSWDMYVCLDLHAKTFIFDKKRCILGSANITGKGLGLVLDSNLEMATLVDIDNNDIEKIERMFDNAVLMTDDIYLKMQKDMLEGEANKERKKVWNDEILSLFTLGINELFVHEFPYSGFDLLNIDFLNVDTEDINVIKDCFKSSKPYKWLIQVLQNVDNNQLYFGSITEKLHNVLINDPKPYRKDVKVLLVNLLDWISNLSDGEIIIERPNYAQLVRMKNVIN